MAKKEEVVDLKSNEVLLKLEKEFGLEPTKLEDMQIINTGSYNLDRATGVGGYVKGKVVELYGPESSGKSTIALHAIAAFQEAIPDKMVALFDYEYSFDMVYAKKLGVDLSKDKQGNYKRFRIYQPDTQEIGYDMIIGMVEKGLVSLIVIDSHTAAPPKSILEGDMDDSTYALQARNNSKFLMKIKGLLDKSKTTLIAISQLRANIGGMSHGNKPPAPITTGGSAFKFYADMRFKIWKANDIEHESNATTVEVVKNKCAPPYGKAEFDIVWGEGIDNYTEIIKMASEYGIIKQSGSWYSYKEDKIGQGKAQVKELLKDNPELFIEIRDLCLNYVEPDEKPASADLTEVLNQAAKALKLE
jgi:recombination protein RecA